MRIHVRFYKHSDRALYTLCEQGIDMNSAIRISLANMAAGKQIKFLLPEIRYKEYRSGSYSRSQKSAFNVTFTTHDKDIIDMMQQIRPGFRNEFIKDTLMQSMLFLPSGSFWRDEGSPYLQRINQCISDYDVANDNNVIVLEYHKKRTPTEIRKMLGLHEKKSERTYTSNKSKADAEATTISEKEPSEPQKDFDQKPTTKGINKQIPRFDFDISDESDDNDTDDMFSTTVTFGSGEQDQPIESADVTSDENPGMEMLSKLMSMNF